MISTLVTVLKKEWRQFLTSPMIFVFWAVGSFFAGGFFYLGLGLSPEPNIRIMAVNLCLTLLFFIPLMSMRAFAEESKQGTLEMILSFPISLPGFVLGKFFAYALVCFVLVLLASFNFAVVVILGQPDWGAFAGAFIGQMLCSLFFLSVGMFASVSTEEPISAGLFGVLLLLPFWLGDIIADTVQVPWIKDLLLDMSIMNHLHPMTKGLIDSVDVLWFALSIAVFLWMTVLKLEGKRWQ